MGFQVPGQPAIKEDKSIMELWGFECLGYRGRLPSILPPGTTLTGAPLSLSWKSGKLSRELDFVSHHVRTKLDELKRQEVSRLRMLLKAKMDAKQEPSECGWMAVSWVGGTVGPREHLALLGISFLCFWHICTLMYSLCLFPLLFISGDLW